MFLRLLLLVLPLGSFIAECQVIIPPYGPAFPQDEVSVIRITIDPDSLAAVLNPDNFHNEREFPAKFRFESNNSSVEFPLVGFRLRGNTSLNAVKKSFKISFNTYEDLKWHGLEKLNLNGNVNDPSMIRVKLCWDALREAGIPGSRTSFVKLYVNNEYRGLYTQVEHFDEEFTQLYFDRKGSGNLYKCLYPATLEYLGPAQNPYKAISGNRRFYELHTTEWADDYSDLVDFIRILNQSAPVSLPCELEKVFNVERYLQIAAFDVITGNWDGYIYNKNNFYLYHDKNTGLFEYIPYDLDNTLGIDWINRDWSTRNIYSWAPSTEDRPLYERLMQVPAYREQFTWYLRQWITGPLKPERISAKSLLWQQLIREAVQEDPYRTLDFGFSFSQYEQSATEAAGGHVKFGIVPFLEARIESALEQAEGGLDQELTLYGGWTDPPLSEGRIYGCAPLIQGLEMSWEYHSGDGNWLPGAALRDDGFGADAEAADGNWAGIFDLPGDPDSVYYRLKGNLGGEQVFWPCEGKLTYLKAVENGPLVINELMSRNNSNITDSKGDFSDWVEIWNRSDQSVNLGDYYLSDDTAEPDQWPLPEIQLAPGAFKLFWCDSEEDYNRDHVNFGLSADGEKLSLYTRKQGSLQLVDQVDFPALAADVSYGRITDGAGTWVKFTAPTPEASNTSSSVSSMEVVSGLFLYPNPGQNIVNLNRKVQQAVLFEPGGRKLREYFDCDQIETGDLAAGLYLIHADGQWIRCIHQP